MLLDRFLLNTDYDTQKEATSITLELQIPEFKINSGQEKYYETTTQIAPGVYFENINIETTLYPDYNFFGTAAITTSSYAMQVMVYRSDATHFKMRIRFYGRNTTTIPTSTTKAAVHLFVATQ